MYIQKRMKFKKSPSQSRPRCPATGNEEIKTSSKKAILTPLSPSSPPTGGGERREERERRLRVVASMSTSGVTHRGEHPGLEGRHGQVLSLSGLALGAGGHGLHFRPLAGGAALEG